MTIVPKDVPLKPIAEKCCIVFNTKFTLFFAMWPTLAFHFRCSKFCMSDSRFWSYREYLPFANVFLLFQCWLTAVKIVLFTQGSVTPEMRMLHFCSVIALSFSPNPFSSLVGYFALLFRWRITEQVSGFMEIIFFLNNFGQWHCKSGKCQYAKFWGTLPFLSFSQTSKT